MGFLRRVWTAARGEADVPARASRDFISALGVPDSLRADTVLATLDIDAAINAHERWKDRLMDSLEGRTDDLDPAEVRRSDQGELGRWLHGSGADLLGDQPAFTVLLARHDYFLAQAALLVELTQQGQWARALQVFHGGYRYGSSQVVLLLKELKRGLLQGS